MSSVVANRFLKGEVVEVAPDRIEAELRAIWRATAAQGSQGVARATVLTLVGFAEIPAALANLKETLDRASSRVPSRILLLLANKKEPESLRSWIAMNFQKLGQGAKQIYSELITIQAGGGAIARMPNLVRGLRVPDVPAVLYWPGPVPSDGDYAKGLFNAVDRLVIDTQDFDEPEELGKFQALLSDHLALTDLDWLRIAPWQILLAHLFDQPHHQGHMRLLDRVVIGHGERATCDAYLFGGWLASRLGWRNPVPWEIDGTGRAWHLVRSDGHPVVVVIRETMGDHSGLLKVHLEAARHDPPATFTVRRVGAALEIRGTDFPIKVRHVQWPVDADLLGRAIRTNQGDRTFTEALKASATLLRANQEAFTF